jgi:hypothetical protein
MRQIVQIAADLRRAGKNGAGSRIPQPQGAVAPA